MLPPPPPLTPQAKRLLPTLFDELAIRYGPGSCADVPARDVAAALSAAYCRLDRELYAAILPAFRLGFGDVARGGACAVSAVVLPKHVVVANGT